MSRIDSRAIGSSAASLAHKIDQTTPGNQRGVNPQLRRQSHRKCGAKAPAIDVESQNPAVDQYANKKNQQAEYNGQATAHICCQAETGEQFDQNDEPGCGRNQLINDDSKIANLTAEMGNIREFDHPTANKQQSQGNSQAMM